MAGANLSPRQRMIGMMYLVLTALLALNVSKEIINAFVTVNASLEVTNRNFADKNAQTYLAFEQAMTNDAAKAKPYYDRAKVAGTLSDSLIAYIEGIKDEVIIKVEKLDPNTPKDKITAVQDIGKKDDYDTPTTYMNGSENDGRGHKATELRQKLIEYKANMLANLAPKDTARFRSRFEELLNTDDPKVVIDKKRTWEMAVFYHNPTVAVITLLTKFQSDVKIAEAEVISHLLRDIDLGDFKFNALQARVIAPTSYVLLGQEYKADVFLAAFSTTSDPEIFVGAVDTASKSIKGEGRLLEVEGGIGRYVDRPSTEGLKKWGGIIKIKKPDNTYESYPFTAEYIASKPSAVVSLDKMNVLYIGVDNPVSISVPGVANENVTAGISGAGGSLSKAGGASYVAKVAAVGEANISITANLEGKQTPMGTFKYRVKRVPDPVAMIANTKGGNVAKNILLAQTAVIPVMENFDFELFFRVTSFKMTYIPRGKDLIEMDSNNNLITGGMKSALSNARPGDKVYFEYIRAVGPDGTTRQLSAVNFTIQ